MKYLQEKLKTGLKPLYEKLFIDVNSTREKDSLCTFCMQWGKNFPDEPQKGILFVGKAVNGWKKDKDNFEASFNNVFDRHDQMIWAKDLEGNKEGYNTKKSAFWRVVKGVSLKVYPESNENWPSHIAWSNLCKVAPSKGGNPPKNLYQEQLDICREILKTEIDILSPQYVVLLSSGMEKDFLYYLNESPTHSEKKMSWDKFEIKLYKIKNVYFIVSVHPQGKNETQHIEAIINAITEIENG